jgi:glycosyltransferase involved in cell wall biosynthesis
VPERKLRASDRATPVVTVVIPTHDRESLLRRSIASALWQREVPLEVVVVDDGSTEATPSLLASITDPRVRAVRHDRARGVAASRNHGIQEARGSWVAFLDDDDLWAPDKLSLQLSAARASGRRWCYAGHVNVDLGDRVVGGEPPLPPDQIVQRLPRSDVVPGGCSGVVATKEILDEAGRFDPALAPLADWDLWLRLARIEPPAGVSRPLVGYRIQARSMSADARRVLSEFEILARRHGEGDRAVLYRYLGWWALRGGDHRGALSFFLRAAARREPGYRVSDLAGDVSYVAGDRLGPGRALGRALLARRRVPDHRGWRAEGQAWIDALPRALVESDLG